MRGTYFGLVAVRERELDPVARPYFLHKNDLMHTDHPMYLY